MTPTTKLKVAIIVFIFSAISYLLGMMVHSEFWHHFANWLGDALALVSF